MDINIYHHYVDRKARRMLKEILAEIKTLKQDLVDNEVIKKQAEILDKSTNELEAAVKKNTPAA